MADLGELKSVDLRTIWPNEATYFTPWLADNLDKLSEALGLDLEFVEQEADVGGFSLDILARDAGSGSSVVIESQLTSTDHDHLGKLLTYAAGFEAKILVWLAQEIRDEHKEAVNWLNQRTDSETSAFAVAVELLSVDGSKPAVSFRLVAAPSEWAKGKRPSAATSSKGEVYRAFFQALLDDLRTNHKFTNARAGQPQGWYAFSSELNGVRYGASFARAGRVRCDLYIDLGEQEENKRFFDALHAERDQIERDFGRKLEWERLDSKRASRIALYEEGRITDAPEQLTRIHQWLISSLLSLRRVFGPRLNQASGAAT